MSLSAFDVLRKNIRTQIDDVTDMLASGGAKDFSQYKEATGVIRGLNSCLREIDDLSRNLEGYEDGD